MTSTALFLGLLGGLGIPLDQRTASDPGPNFGGVVGLELEREKVTLRPEVMFRVNTGAPVITAPIGLSAVWGGTVGAGVYGHTSIPIAQTYPFPGLHLGGQVALRPGPLRASLRVGYELAHSPHYKCGDCPQPSDSWLAVDLVVGVRF